MTYLVSETTSTSGLAAMRVSERPTVGLSIATSPLVELTTWTEPWRSLGVNPPTPRFLRSYCARLLSSFENHGDVGVMGSREFLAFEVLTSPPFDDDVSCNWSCTKIMQIRRSRHESNHSSCCWKTSDIVQNKQNAIELFVVKTHTELIWEHRQEKQLAWLHELEKVSNFTAKAR